MMSEFQRCLFAQASCKLQQIESSGGQTLIGRQTPTVLNKQSEVTFKSHPRNIVAPPSRQQQQSQTFRAKFFHSISVL